MARNQKTFEVACKGRNFRGEGVLLDAISVKIVVHQNPGSSTISSDVSDCRYNCGGHGERCRAYSACHPKVKVEAGCPYSFDIPHALEKKR